MKVCQTRSDNALDAVAMRLPGKNATFSAVS